MGNKRSPVLPQDVEKKFCSRFAKQELSPSHWREEGAEVQALSLREDTISISERGGKRGGKEVSEKEGEGETCAAALIFRRGIIDSSPLS